MSTRENVLAGVAVAAWGAAVIITIALGDIHKTYTLLVSGASIITVALIFRVVARSSGRDVAKTVSEQTAALTRAILERREVPIPVEVAHQVGFKQGWRAAQIQNPSQLADLVDVFEKRFPEPHN